MLLCQTFNKVLLIIGMMIIPNKTLFGQYLAKTLFNIIGFML
ncbi:hypothetical protein [Moraxella lacunata]